MLRASLFAVALATSDTHALDFPVYPFKRQLSFQSPLQTGIDVYILQNMLLKNGLIPTIVNSAYDNQTSTSVASFQTSAGLDATGVFDAATAAAAVQQLSRDRYVDDGKAPASLGYLYKVYIQVHQNRSIESTAHLIAGNGTYLFNFTVRAHGADGYPPGPWPTWNSSDDGVSQFSDDGNTPTGLAEFDLNGPEDNSTEYGPYPVNRAVKGLAGNWEWVGTNDAATMVRDGILLQ